MKKLVSVLLLVLLLAPAALAESHAPIALTDDIYAACNLFLSNFTEAGYDEIPEFPDDGLLVDFAHDHLWFNSNDAFEHGEYFGGNNCRVSDERIYPIVDKYFYAKPRQLEMIESAYDYRDDYLYSCQTGCFTKSGFALTTSITPLEEDQYFASILIFGAGEHWENDALTLTLDEAWEQFGKPYTCRHAVVYATDLADRSTYKLVSYS